MSELRRIRPPDSHDGVNQLIQKLIDLGPFDSKQAVMMFAAAVGRYVGKREPVDKFGEGIRWQVFEKNEDDAYVYALALAETGNLHALADTDESSGDDVATIFEEYANAGLRYLEEQIMRIPGDITDEILKLIADARRQVSAPQVGLEGLSAETLSFLGGEKGKDK